MKTVRLARYLHRLPYSREQKGCRARFKAENLSGCRMAMKGRFGVAAGVWETRPFSRDEVGSEMCAREIAPRVRWYLSASGCRIFARLRLLISKSLNSEKNREI